MALPVSGIVGSAVRGDGQEALLRFGRNSEQVVSELHGVFAEQNRRGRVVTYNSASTGIALIVPATTGNHPTLWNPAGSGRLLSIISLELTYVSGNNAPTALNWAATKNAGANIGTAAPIVTFTDGTTIESGMVGAASIDRVARWAPAVCTFLAAPVFCRSAGISLFTGVAATAVAPFPLVAKYNGEFMVAPGTAISLCSQAATTTALFQVSLTVEEIDI